MSSTGIRSNIRHMVLRSDVFGLGIAVLVGMTLYQLLYATIEWVAVPLVRGLFETQEVGQFGPQYEPLYLNFRGFPVYYGETLTLATMLIASVLIGILFARRVFRPTEKLEAEATGRLEFSEGHEFRHCPECMSRIPISAHRCAYCTALLAPREQ